MIARAVTVTLLAVVGFVILLAQADDSDRAACHADAVKFCPHALAGGPFSVAGCLSANKAKLSPRCRAVLEAHGL
jgi:hypothetical protein